MKCHICGENIPCHVKYIDGKPTCKRCYYKELGNLMETHQIGIYRYDKEETPD